MDELYVDTFDEQPDVQFYLAENKENYITQRKMLRTSIITPFLKKKGGIKYVCYMNTTGYSIAARGYIAALHLAGFNVTVETVGNHPPPLDDTTNNQISNFCYGRDIQYDKVIIHTVPDLFERYAKREKGKKVYGLTVWETDDIPKSWQPMFDHIDEVIVPCEWNKKCFGKTISKPISVVHHVINNDFVRPLQIAKGKFMFYFIGEWCNRKGIDLLIKAFKELFERSKDVVLYIKTFAFHEILASDEMDLMLKKHRSEKIIINTDKVDDNFIAALHQRGDAYVSFAKGEGVGLGAAESAMHGNIVIAADYGGHSDYLKGQYLAKYKEVQCQPCDSFHKKCKDGKCHHYSWYDSTHQNWCEPDYKDMKRLMWKAYENGGGKRYNPMTLKFSHQEVGKQFSKILF